MEIGISRKTIILLIAVVALVVGAVFLVPPLLGLFSAAAPTAGQKFTDWSEGSWLGKLATAFSSLDVNTSRPGADRVAAWLGRDQLQSFCSFCVQRINDSSPFRRFPAFPLDWSRPSLTSFLLRRFGPSQHSQFRARIRMRLTIGVRR